MQQPFRRRVHVHVHVHNPRSRSYGRLPRAPTRTASPLPSTYRSPSRAHGYSRHSCPQGRSHVAVRFGGRHRRCPSHKYNDNAKFVARRITQARCRRHLRDASAPATGAAPSRATPRLVSSRGTSLPAGGR
ncbi:hypothetical protein C8Q78DRAFT_369680 [Trametes maxima]|nr:hypothetical protein C8Q78DRAFT_369680 [Trametes maxima]